jgi:3-hydroxyisobutyrate dehydrogenase-like beta-hydroxyacid dehydrogenase
VLTYAKDRSETTRRRAENLGVVCMDSLDDLVASVDLIVSIVVPFAAKRVAAKVAKAAAKRQRRDLLYLDANAISPMTAGEIGTVLSRSGVEFVDGCIIGSAAKIDKGAVVYVSGPQAARVQELESHGFAVRVLGDAVAQASAFKVVYAGLTKGLQGLFVELLVGAKKFGLLGEIIARYEESFPGLLERVAPSIVGLRIHAARRAEEMVELKQTFSHNGMTAVVAPAIQKILRAIADLKPGESSESAVREGNLLDTLELFYEKGLLQESRSRAAVEESETASISG